MRRRHLVALLALALASCNGASTRGSLAPARIATPCPSISTPATAQPGRITFRVAYDGGSDAGALDGRLLVAMTSLSDASDPFEVGFMRLRDEWVAAAQIGPVAHGGHVDVDPDTLAWPRPFSTAPEGRYRIAVRLVRPDQHELHGPVIERTLDPAHAGPIELSLASPEAPELTPRESDGVKVVTYESRLLSAFYGRPVAMNATVELPAGYSASRKYPAEYYIRALGNSFALANRQAQAERQKRIEAGYPPMVRVVLSGMLPSGHHVFADSVNDGPWGRALVEELVPELERRFSLIASPHGRFVAGHSSGGWAALWLQITHPEYFAGAWATAPDPVDFRSFHGLDVTPGSKANAFHDEHGARRGLMRADGRDVYSFEDFVRYEDVTGEVLLGTFDWVFSPRGAKGEPLRLFDRATGEQDPFVQHAWEKWDIRKMLEARWPTLGPRLRGKLHVFVGDADSFRLNESVSLLCDFLASKKSDATCDIVAGKNHFNLSGDPTDERSIVWRIEHEMARAATR
jgi:hypothetical protein